MIIWISSYPKSGNTWVRAFVASLLYDENGINDLSQLKKIKQFPTRKLFKHLMDDFQNIEKIYENWINVQDYINLDNQVKLLKTHHVNCKIGKFNFTNDENSLGVIHIVRDPRNIITSIKNHFSIQTLKEAKNFIFNENNWVGIVKNNKDELQDNKIPTLISSWKTNYLSWRKRTKNYLLIRYEDLVKNPNEEFFKISIFLEKTMNKKFSEKKVFNAIRTSSFDNMKELEQKEQFNEFVTDSNNQKVKFFNLGPKNDWKSFLSDEIVEEINFKFKNEMQELGYL